MSKLPAPRAGEDARLALAGHHQKSPFPCIPSAIELVLKLEGKASQGRQDLQSDHFHAKDLDFGKFDGQTINGITFARRDFGDDLGRLRSEIESELRQGRLVIIALEEGGQTTSGAVGVHAWVILGALGDEFVAVSRCPNCGPVLVERSVWAKARARATRKGTDILVYEPETSS